VRPLAQTPPDKSRLDKVKDTLRTFVQRPASGRTTLLGRRVEKPGSGKPGGPSGQREIGQLDGKHANK
jgi:hypothetical protein